MALLGEAVSLACSRLDPQFLRVNYEILGNEYPHLHAHIFARYAREPDERRRSPVWLYPDRKANQYALGPQHDELRVALSAALDEVTASAAQP
jgi:diadenosine tetraphosphate (Ap4A) HIT family hydrolase